MCSVAAVLYNSVRPSQASATVCRAAANGRCASTPGIRLRTASAGASAAACSTDLPWKRVDRLPLPEATKQSLYGMGITKLFDIQARAFNSILRGRSFVGRSHTGTGKTVAYLLPVLERMRKEKMSAPHSLLILVPTRELCKQVGGTVVTLAVTQDVALVYGGPSLASQEQLVRLGPSIVIATPGRCAHLVQRGALQTQNVKVLVIDEADSMLGLEHFGRVEKVLAAVAKKELQSILFSASLPREVRAVTSKHFVEYEFVDLVDRGGVNGAAAVQAVTHHLCKVPKARVPRVRVLLHLLSTKLSLEHRGRCIIFVESASEAKSLLTHPGFDRRARALHSDSTLQDRDVVLSAFANREFDVLIATDIFARGIDFEDVSMVLQLHPPSDPTQYVHRAGRTGRGGQGGTCITLYDGSEHALVQRVRDTTKQHFCMEAAPGSHDLHSAAVNRLLDELLTVRPEEFGPLLGDAARLLREQGPRALAAAMAVLDSRHADLEHAARQSPSLLSGRRGFTCLLAHDPEHTAASSEGECRRVAISLLRHAREDVIGEVARTAEGWALDVQQSRAATLVEDLRTGRQSAPFEISVANNLPRLLRSFSQRARRTPWYSMRKSAFRKRQ